MSSATAYSPLLTDENGVDQSSDEAQVQAQMSAAASSPLLGDEKDVVQSSDEVQVTIDATKPKSLEERKEAYRLRVGEQSLNFCEEHFTRCPKRKTKEGSITNLYGFTNRRWVQGVEIFVLTRVLTVYDIGMDIVITGRIDKKRDPFWFTFSVVFLVSPVLIKGFLFQKVIEERIAERIKSKNKWIIRSLFVLFTLVGLTFIDLYLLVMYPWVPPTDAAFLGMLERLSPLVDMLEGLFQSSFQIYMYIRMQQLSRDLQSMDMNRLLLSSFLPCMAGIAWKVYNLRLDAQSAGMDLVPYTKELYKGPLGLSAPFLTLLNKRSAVSYTGMGSLNKAQQGQIFKAIGASNETLQEIDFDKYNNINYEDLGKAIAENDTLTFVTVSDPDLSLAEIMELLAAGGNNHFKGRITILQQDFTSEDCRHQKMQYEKLITPFVDALQSWRTEELNVTACSKASDYITTLGLEFSTFKAGSDAELGSHSSAPAPRSYEVDLRLIKECMPGAMRTPTIEDKQLPCHLAAMLGHCHLLRFIHEVVPEAVPVEDNNGSMPIHLAAEKGNELIVRFLHEVVPETFKFLDNYGRMPSHVAVEKGNELIVRFLREVVPETFEVANSKDVINGKFIVLLKKTRDNNDLGMEVDIGDLNRMLVANVTGGMVRQWNENNPKLKIKEGDEILSVNGVAGDVEKMSEAMARHATEQASLRTKIPLTSRVKIEVVGAGTASVNGVYTCTGDEFKQENGTHSIVYGYREGGGWYITTYEGGGYILTSTGSQRSGSYFCQSGDREAGLPKHGWVRSEGSWNDAPGDAPMPTITEVQNDDVIKFVIKQMS